MFVKVKILLLNQTETFFLRHGFLTLKMRTASFAHCRPCIRLEKSVAGSAFSTVTQFTVNGRDMCYILRYKRPLTDIDFFLFASYRVLTGNGFQALSNDFGCRIQILKKDKKNLRHFRLFMTWTKRTWNKLYQNGIDGTRDGIIPIGRTSVQICMKTKYTKWERYYYQMIFYILITSQARALFRP